MEKEELLKKYRKRIDDWTADFGELGKFVRVGYVDSMIKDLIDELAP